MPFKSVFLDQIRINTAQHSVRVVLIVPSSINLPLRCVKSCLCTTVHHNSRVIIIKSSLSALIEVKTLTQREEKGKKINKKLRCSKKSPCSAVFCLHTSKDVHPPNFHNFFSVMSDVCLNHFQLYFLIKSSIVAKCGKNLCCGSSSLAKMRQIMASKPTQLPYSCRAQLLWHVPAATN